LTSNSTSTVLPASTVMVLASAGIGTPGRKTGLGAIT